MVWNLAKLNSSVTGVQSFLSSSSVKLYSSEHSSQTSLNSSLDSKDHKVAGIVLFALHPISLLEQYYSDQYYHNLNPIFQEVISLFLLNLPIENQHQHCVSIANDYVDCAYGLNSFDPMNDPMNGPIRIYTNNKNNVIGHERGLVIAEVAASAVPFSVVQVCCQQTNTSARLGKVSLMFCCRDRSARAGGKKRKEETQEGIVSIVSKESIARMLEAMQTWFPSMKPMVCIVWVVLTDLFLALVPLLLLSRSFAEHSVCKR